MLGIVGTIPDVRIPMIHGCVRMVGSQLWVADQRIPINRGTPALLAAVASASASLNGPDIYAFLVGDIGAGQGSRSLYQFLAQHVHEFDLKILTFHYLQPDVDWHNKVLFAVEAMTNRPMLIADAGFMYAAKMSGQAGRYDFFTPDAGELAFLADEMAPHPFYTRGFILHQKNKVEDLIRQAYHNDNAATHLLVKGSTDYVVHQDRVVAKVESPSFPAMEAIGGTGDTLTGLLTALCGSGFDPLEAAVTAATANRFCGFFSHPTPATQICELIKAIPQALEKGLTSRHA